MQAQNFESKYLKLADLFELLQDTVRTLEQNQQFQKSIKEHSNHLFYVDRLVKSQIVLYKNKQKTNQKQAYVGQLIKYK